MYIGVPWARAAFRAVLPARTSAALTAAAKSKGGSISWHLLDKYRSRSRVVLNLPPIHRGAYPTNREAATLLTASYSTAGNLGRFEIEPRGMNAATIENTLTITYIAMIWRIPNETLRPCENARSKSAIPDGLSSKTMADTVWPTTKLPVVQRTILFRTIDSGNTSSHVRG